MCRIAMSDNKVVAMKNMFIIAVIMMILYYYYAAAALYTYMACTDMYITYVYTKSNILKYSIKQTTNIHGSPSFWAIPMYSPKPTQKSLLVRSKIHSTVLPRGMMVLG